MSIRKKPSPYRKSIDRGSPNIFTVNRFHHPMIAPEVCLPAIWNVGIPPNMELVHQVQSSCCLLYSNASCAAPFQLFTSPACSTLPSKIGEQYAIAKPTNTTNATK